MFPLQLCIFLNKETYKIFNRQVFGFIMKVVVKRPYAESTPVKIWPIRSSSDIGWRFAVKESAVECFRLVYSIMDMDHLVRVRSCAFNCILQAWVWAWKVFSMACQAIWDEVDRVTKAKARSDRVDLSHKSKNRLRFLYIV